MEKGLSMVVELKMSDKSWSAFMSDRLPSELDDAIKGKHAEFYMVARSLRPDQLLEAIPMGFPMTHLLSGFPGVAKYPVDRWEQESEPYMSVKSWAKLCMNIAQNEETNLGRIMEVAKKYEGARSSTDPQ